ncbi:hypothetical protein J6590_086657 [Homalodisca vitripennis]|nr:hypothetical protein J6590_086657 [Homalodisca vitripennis]
MNGINEKNSKSARQTDGMADDVIDAGGAAVTSHNGISAPQLPHFSVCHGAHRRLSPSLRLVAGNRHASCRSYRIRSWRKQEGKGGLR